MRRSTLGSMTPAQLNSRSGAGSSAAQNGPKFPRTQSGKQQQAQAQGQGRQSLSRRSSSMYGKGTGLTQADPRPIGDRAFQQECIRTMVNYLTSHGYQNPVSQKILQTPSSKEVVSIIQFLFLQLDPNWEFRKIEEDVPLVFKRLGYPVQISRSALYAAGSPVSWPSLLAALTWLVNLLVAMEPSDDSETDSPFGDPRNALFTDYVNMCYYHFLRGEDDHCDALDEALKKKVRDENAMHAAELAVLHTEANQLQEKLRKLRSEPSPSASLRALQADYKDDISKFNTVIGNFLTHKEAMEVKLDEKRQELASKKEEVDSISRENEELRERVGAQQIHAVDVERMLKEKEILEVNLQSVSGRKQELEKTAWDYEVNSSKMLRELETTVSQFNDTTERLGLGSGEGSQGQSQYEIKLQPRADTAAGILGGTVKTIIKPALLEIMEKSKKTLAEEINPEILRLQEQVFKREISARQKQSQISNAVAHNKKLEAQYKLREENTDVIRMRAEREELEARLVEEELALKNDEAESEYELGEIQAEYDSTLKECNEEIEDERKMGTEILEIILNTKEGAQATLKRVEEATTHSIEVFRELISSSSDSQTTL